ncbi:MAG: ADP-ribosylglycohydrolase family protein [Rikenellaceae bacterium]
MAKISKFGQAGIVEFIDLTQDKHLKPYNKFVHGGMEYNNFPIQDVSVPSQPEYMYDIVSYINRAIEREHKTYIHCWGGVGRTGTVVACYFVYKGDTAEQALMKLAVLWKSCEKSKRKPNSPETNEQLVFVYKFADFMMQKRLEIKNSNIVLSRIHGSLIGGAVGDALGYTVEFSNLVGIRRIYGERGITRYSLDDRGLAIISDDTQMTLFTATSLLFGVTHGIMKGIMDSLESYVWELGYEVWLRTQAFESYEDIARNSKGVRTSLNLQWLQNINELYSRRAPGMTCLSALESGNMGTIEKPINNSKGCGGVMRVAPVGIYSYKYFNGECNIVMLGAKVAAITHGHELGYIPAGMLSHLVWSIIDNIKGGMTLLDHVTRSLTVTKTCFKDALHINEFDNIINRAIELSEQSMPDHEAIAILGEGWVAEEALAIAIYSALKHKDNFKDAIVSSVNHSGDSDSTGSICGNIIGAFLGVSAIPHYYIDRLELKDIIKEIGDDLHSGCIVRNYDYIDNSEKRRWKDKYIMGNYPIK